LPADAVVVEIGSFLGCSTILLAGGRKVAGSGNVHCVDPFDASGDAFSVPNYRAIRGALGTSLRQRFEAHLRRAGLREWVEAHQGTGAEIARTWRAPVDLLFPDGDQSYAGVRPTYDPWWPFLRPGGVIAVHNSADRVYAPGHDGARRLVLELITRPRYGDTTCIGTTRFARKLASAGESGA
jgi:predicted O-methyltransferase YrrM